MFCVFACVWCVQVSPFGFKQKRQVLIDKTAKAIRMFKLESGKFVATKEYAADYLEDVMLCMLFAVVLFVWLFVFVALVWIVVCWLFGFGLFEVVFHCVCAFLCCC